MKDGKVHLTNQTKRLKYFASKNSKARRSPFSSAYWNCLWSLQWRGSAWRMNRRQWIWQSTGRHRDSPLFAVAGPPPAHPLHPPSLPSSPRRSPLETRPGKRCQRGRKWSCCSPRNSSCWSIPPSCSLSENGRAFKRLWDRWRTVTAESSLVVDSHYES